MNPDETLRLSISSMGFDPKCPRRTHMEILTQNVRMDDDFEENKYSVAGKILHEILQSTLTFDFQIVEYYYYRQKMTLEKSLESTMNLLAERWKNLLNSSNLKYPWYQDSEFQEFCLDLMDSSIRIIAKLATSLIIPGKKRLLSLVIGTEFSVDYLVNLSTSIIGKIDILAWDHDLSSLRVIEFKSGKKKLAHENQVRTYGEIIRKSFDLPLILELWYVNNNKRAQPKIINLNNVDTEITRLENILNESFNAIYENDLPKMAENDWTCRYCRLCYDYIDQIFSDNESRSFEGLLDWFD